MAKPVMPLGSLEAHGSIGKTLTFKRRKSRNSVSHYHRPGDVHSFTPTMRQREIRMLRNLILIRWQNMSDEEKAPWRAMASTVGNGVSGWNMFYKYAFKDTRRHLGLVGYWAMNNIVSGKIPDLSQLGYDMQLLPTYPSDCPTLTPSRSPKLGNVVECDGNNDYLSAGLHAVHSPANALTVVILINVLEAHASEAGAFGNCSSTEKSGWNILVKSNNQIRFTFGYTASFRTLSSNNSIPAGTRKAVVITYDRQHIKIFIGGKKDNELACTEAITAGANNLLIGKRNVWNYTMHARYDEAQIYERAMSEEEAIAITKLYAQA